MLEFVSVVMLVNNGGISTLLLNTRLQPFTFQTDEEESGKTIGQGGDFCLRWVSGLGLLLLKFLRRSHSCL
jgi:hypothetical protein